MLLPLGGKFIQHSLPPYCLLFNGTLGWSLRLISCHISWTMRNILCWHCSYVLINSKILHAATRSLLFINSDSILRKCAYSSRTRWKIKVSSIRFCWKRGGSPWFIFLKSWINEMFRGNSQLQNWMLRTGQAPQLLLKYLIILLMLFLGNKRNKRETVTVIRISAYLFRL